MTGPDGAAREVTARAVRRLGWIELVLLLLAALVALVAGALTAWLLEDALGWTFHPAWLASSTLYLLGPALLVRVRDRRAAAAHRAQREDERKAKTSDPNDG